MALLNNADEPELNLPDAEVNAAHRRNLEEADRLLAELRRSRRPDGTSGGSKPATSKMKSRPAGGTYPASPNGSKPNASGRRRGPHFAP
jgi:hypothetical protein